MTDNVNVKVHTYTRLMQYPVDFNIMNILLFCILRSMLLATTATHTDNEKSVDRFFFVIPGTNIGLRWMRNRTRKLNSILFGQSIDATKIYFDARGWSAGRRPCMYVPACVSANHLLEIYRGNTYAIFDTHIHGRTRTRTRTHPHQHIEVHVASIW